MGLITLLFVSSSARKAQLVGTGGRLKVILGYHPATWGSKNQLGGGNSNIFYFYPDPWGNHAT